MKNSQELDDDYGRAIFRRIDHVPDSVVYDAHYHHQSRAESELCRRFYIWFQRFARKIKHDVVSFLPTESSA